eukprot:CAMPEP_0185726590 /NCGR_PEP_ID=MMETSP1171-20130828/2525_1 /TAXON_ID=374046 /ORGANISM="Helicotheca tamensis, Strain CCMP826" /LENGTH=325 /DNA_ID=CAMNT_0028394975 /DNA_START=72 /DNA_END=1049 /DNA_ORIENTATION=-
MKGREIDYYDSKDTEESEEGNSATKTKEDAIRAAAMLGLVSVGLMMVLLIFFWPLALLKDLKWSVTAEVVHVTALIMIPFPYLYIHRKACIPIRMLLTPLVNEVAKSESIREKETTWYNKCSELPQTKDAQTLLNALKSSARRDLKKKFKIFHERGITTKTLHSDFLSLSEDIPVIWAHEKRAVQGTNKLVLEEFLKRFLVVFLVSSAYIDRYYDANENICALGLFVASRNILNNFVYFCLESQSQSGIWQYHHFRALLRATASSPDISFINFFVHQSFAKRLAGAVAADYRDSQLLNTLYPFCFYKEPPTHVVHLRIDLENLRK